MSQRNFKIRKSRSSRTGGEGDPLLLAVDCGIAASLLLVPLVLGGRYPIGQFVCCAVLLFTALAWVLRQCRQATASFRSCGAELILLAVVAIPLLQLAPLPEPILQRVSPQVASSLPLWSSTYAEASNFGVWSQVSLHPQETKTNLVLLLSYCLLFLVAVQRLNDLKDIEKLLTLMAAAAAGIALLALMQRVAGNGKYVWIFWHAIKPAGEVVTGPFVNKNHFAHFLALGMGPLWWQLQQRLRAKSTSTNSFARNSFDLAPLLRTFAAAALAMVVIAGLLSASRGGFIAAAAATVSIALIYGWGELLDRRLLASISLTAVLLGAITATFFDVEAAGDRIGTLASGSLEEMDQQAGRRQIWTANLKAFSQYPVLGAGAGSHLEVYPTYMESSAGVEFTHAENGYLQILLETGVPGGLLILFSLGMCGLWCYRALRHAPSTAHFACAGAVTAGLAASAAHSFVDYVWFVPSCMSFALLLAAAACRLSQLATTEPPAVSAGRGVWIGTAAGLLLAAGFMLLHLSGPARAREDWKQYLVLSMNSERTSLKDLNNSEVRSPSLETRIRHLENVLRLDPHDARAHLRLASMLMQQFDLNQQDSENAMSITQIRDAALASQFPDRKSLSAWLHTAFGNGIVSLQRALGHSRRGLELCPLQGEGYLYLAELEFLEAPKLDRRRHYVAQALRIRPFDGDVLFAAGKEAALAGDAQTALGFWQRAFVCGNKQQQRIVALLASQTSASFFLEKFQPNYYGANLLVQTLQQQGRSKEIEPATNYLLQQLQRQAESATGAQAARYWLQAQSIYAGREQWEQAAACLETALQHDGNNGRMRQQYAQALTKLQRYDEAVAQYKWCLLRTPGDETLKRRMKEATILSLKGGPPQTAEVSTSEATTNR